MSEEKSESIRIEDIDELPTYKRKYMICTKCGTRKLEASPFEVDDWDGVGKLFRATRCRNEECEYHTGVPEVVIERQYSSPSLIDNLLGRVDWGLEEWQKGNGSKAEDGEGGSRKKFLG